jgi:hypothetical protein
MKSLNSLVSGVRKAISLIPQLDEKLDEVKINQGLFFAELHTKVTSNDLRDYEYKVFSQWGQDGIIQRLIKAVAIESNTFIEFGVQDFSESNCRYLMMKNNWSGFIIDGSSSDVSRIKRSYFYWKYDLNAIDAFVTRDNINNLLAKSGFGERLGVLSIDIDGNDYWVWEAIDAVSPSVTIIEYNSRFGADRAVVVPYKADFVRSREHYSNIYFGASLSALCLLGKRKGYAFVGCNSAGNDAFFVRQDLKPSQMPELTPQQGFVRAKFRDARGRDGDLSFLTGDEEAAILRDLLLVEIV